MERKSSTFHSQKWLKLSEQGVQRLCSPGLTSLYISLHTHTTVQMFGKSLRLQTPNTFTVKWAEWTKTWTASIVNAYFFIFKVICHLICSIWYCTNTSNLYKPLWNEMITHIHLRQTWNTMASWRSQHVNWDPQGISDWCSLQLPCWVNFPQTQEAMLMAFTHQCPQKSATTRQHGAATVKSITCFQTPERAGGVATCLLHCKIHHVLFEPPLLCICLLYCQYLSCYFFSKNRIRMILNRQR